jgi:protein-tyrosine phosphatase
VLIRRAQTEDAPAIVALREAAAQWLLARGIAQWQSGEVSAQDVHGWLATGRLYVAEQAGHLVGVVRVAWSDPAVWGPVEADPRSDDAGYIHALIAARSVAGQGVGRDLLRHAETVIAATGRPLARLDCVASNAALIGYYSLGGYTVVGHHEFARDVGWHPVTLMEKRLS